MDKKQLRKVWMERRASITPEDRERLDRLATDNLMATEEYQNAEHIFTFINFGDEIDTQRLIRESLALGKKIYLPVTEKGVDRMKLTALKDMDDLIVGHYGILTPKPEALDFIDHNLVDLVIVPGLAFDQEGYRLGYGAGYYDKFFSDLTAKPSKLGFCYAFQRTDSLPYDEYDVPVDRVITDIP
ncbi:MAG: 5-formyltetrahydrofolate cyclo-ligase [Tissierellia bacterium]|nr:5-formyltetrahydrofolate cyclo-ligase [Tissierellia bacterium]